MEALFQYGAVGIVCAAAIWDISYLQKQTFRVIERNTQVISELQKIIEHCKHQQQDDGK